jgi:hypothetical protein
MSNLDNPRHLAFGPEGGLYVAEAGHGGAGPCIFIRGANQCAGPSGVVSRLRHGIQSRIAFRANADGSRTPVVAGLIAPGGFTFRPDGALYVSNKSVVPGGAGEVLRFEP